VLQTIIAPQNLATIGASVDDIFAGVYEERYQTTAQPKPVNQEVKNDIDTFFLAVYNKLYDILL